MKSSITTCVLCACIVIACEQRKDEVGTTLNEARGVEPDNAKKNERDRKENAKTPMDQGNDDADVEITREIRRLVLEQPNFSINAQNVKIITEDGRVTLRGPVNTPEEKSTIERLARAQTGVKNLVSELEVKAEENNGNK